MLKKAVLLFVKKTHDNVPGILTRPEKGETKIHQGVSMIKKMNKLQSALLALLLTCGSFFNVQASSQPLQSGELPAFPGASGFGSNTTHGRGGSIIEVTNLNDSGAGSLRDAISKSGARIVVFKVSGTIKLSQHLKIDNPYIYIAGQTSVNGVQILGAGIQIRTHDVLIRGLMIRPGDGSSGAPLVDRTGIIIHNDRNSTQPYNIVIDHNSVEWGTDEVVSTYRPVHDVTFSNNIVAEGLYCAGHPDGCHSMGMGIGPEAKNVTIYANLIANNDWRNPMVGGSTTVEVINNLVYAWGAGGTIINSSGEGASLTNVIGNYYIPVSCADSKNVLIHSYASGSKLYYDDWSSITGGSSAINSLKTLAHAFTPSNVVPATKDEAYHYVLKESGARNDPIDTRIKNNVINRTLPNGNCLIDSQSEVGGWTTITNATYTDTDKDGMPDSWELANGLNPNNAADKDSILCNYTAVEQYVNSFYGAASACLASLGHFSDVSSNYWAQSYIEILYNSGITDGCSAGLYCPEATVTRAQMAVFLLKGIHGSDYTPPAGTSEIGFSDVASDFWAAAWIKQLAAESITGGCGDGAFCPDASVTRAQMAIFLLKAKHGASYSPPPAAGIFDDVPTDHWAAAWIEQLAAEGITGGCGAGTYCPDSSVTRAQMAVFLVKTFNLQ